VGSGPTYTSTPVSNRGHAAESLVFFVIIYTVFSKELLSFTPNLIAEFVIER